MTVCHLELEAQLPNFSCRTGYHASFLHGQQTGTWLLRYCCSDRERERERERERGEGEGGREGERERDLERDRERDDVFGKAS